MSSRAWIAVTGITVVMGLGGCGTVSPYVPAPVGYSDARNASFEEDNLGANGLGSSPVLGVSVDYRFF
ncbi:MAG: hypothetical protein OEP48_00075 [Betaproteobacteria bacterium]|nr:hypothetical protein [Betaproteobacteria bacterium]MDH3435655.1 hypothetical protein [Betaproteobacteria bacterium]